MIDCDLVYEEGRSSSSRLSSINNVNIILVISVTVTLFSLRSSQEDSLSITISTIYPLIRDWSLNFNLKVGYHTESRCQYQPASFSSAFKLSGTACLVGVGVGVPSSDLGHVMKEITTSPHPLLLLLHHFTPLQGVLTPFPNYFM